MHAAPHPQNPGRAGPALLPATVPSLVRGARLGAARHQLELLAKAQAGSSALLIAPTGAGKTLAGFLPTLIELSSQPSRTSGSSAERTRARRLHTLYISPLKALAVDIARNLERAGRRDGPADQGRDPHRRHAGAQRQRQRRDPPDILLTTPEQLALLLAVRRRAVPVLVACSASCSTSCMRWSPPSAAICCRSGWRGCGSSRRRLRAIGLSATVAEPDVLRALSGAAARRRARRRRSSSSPAVPRRRSSRFSIPSERAALGRAFRAPCDRRDLRADQAQQDHAGLRQHPQPGRDAVPGAVAHQRRRPCRSRCITARSTSRSAARSRRRWRRAGCAAVVCTSTLDLGIDWGDVDLVIHVGAPKGASRLMQRIGRANHRLDEPRRRSWCRPTASRCWNAAPRSTPSPRTRRIRRRCAPARSTCWPSTCSAAPAASRFDADELYDEVRDAPRPIASSDRAGLRRRRRFRRHRRLCARSLRALCRASGRTKDGRWRVANPQVAQSYRLNVGTIVEAAMLKVRLVRSRHAPAARLDRRRSRAAAACSARSRNISSKA